MLVVTGALGFIGSFLVGYLNSLGHTNIVAVDDFDREDKAANLANKSIAEKVHRNDFEQWLVDRHHEVEVVFHLGARTDTTEFDYLVLESLNLLYTQDVWRICSACGIPLIYASSAATYGGGELGYSDDLNLSLQLKPLNPYGQSKNEFDKWIIDETERPPFWAGLKFFNVYGPNEYHKGRMASVHWHFFKQIRDTGKVRLFASHKPEVADGEQQRDFVYVRDVVEILWWLYENRETVKSDLYNLGTGQARSYNDLAKAMFQAMKKPVTIEYIPTPEDIRNTYQYFTEADMHKLRAQGYTNDFWSLENGANDYVQRFLNTEQYY